MTNTSLEYIPKTSTLITKWITSTPPAVAQFRTATSQSDNSLQVNIIFGVLATLLGFMSVVIAFATLYARLHRSNTPYITPAVDNGGLESGLAASHTDLPLQIQSAKSLELDSDTRYDRSLVKARINVHIFAGNDWTLWILLRP